MNQIPITGHTALYGLLGKPASHSISPAMHNLSFRANGIDAVYLAFEAGEKELPAAVEGLRALGAKGFNLTMPNKNKMVSLCDELSPAARITQAVNTVVIGADGRLTGHNTDGTGYMLSVRDAGYSIIGKKMTLLGAGGAATAIWVQAALDGVAEISVFLRRESRFYARAEQTAAMLKRQTACKIRLCDYNDADALRAELADSYILTNATSVGMAPREDASPVPDAALFPDGLIVSDIIYNPQETLLLNAARENGNPCFNGYYMLLYQGAEAFRLWTGRQMPVSLVKQAYFT
ncbi:MAG: shikimate dehydrogenase [Lachnospiraceae bacterium]|jgi:quinate/shikimate dehydrogenase|nr:shikimate dehydrogenase [Lachnospiraceae bacterium]